LRLSIWCICSSDVTMVKIVGKERPSKEAEIAALRRAIAVERRARYADFQGRHSTFSYFMRNTADRLVRRFPLDPVWTTIRAFFRQYPNSDVATRISIVSRAEELLAPYFDQLERGPEAAQTSQIDAGSVHRVGTTESKAATSGIPGPENLVENKAVTKPLSAPVSASGVLPVSAQGAMPASGQGAMPASGPVSDSGALPVNSPGAKSIRGAVRSESKSGSNTERNSSHSTHTTKERPDNSGKQGARSQNIAEIPVQFVKGVGPKLASLLDKLGITTVEKLLCHYPRKHLDFQNREHIRDLVVGDEVSIFGTIRSVSAYQAKKGNVSILTAILSDGTGSIMVSRFVGGKSNKYLLDRYKAQFPKGAQVLASGVVERDDYSGKLKLKNAEIEILSLAGGDQLSAGFRDDPSALGSPGQLDMPESLHVGRLVPVYPLTEGLSLRYLRNIIHNALTGYGALIVDPLPELLREKFGLMGLRESFYKIHFPENPEDKDAARRRLVFDELFAIQLQMAHRRYQYEQREDALSIKYEPGENSLVNRLKSSLPFKLTGAQDRVFGEIARDLASNKPMHRLVQGDVGSGKTVVALLAFMVAIENGFQGAMMAPTEILAEQHYRQFQRLMAPLGLRATLVLGKHGARERRLARQEILSGQSHIAVGTHALLEDDVEFQNLGLIIIDEQHRFGVKQRARLKAKSLNPELLTMTATPIPRTMALTMHGDLDVSEIDELPPGRKPIVTEIVMPSKKKALWQKVREQIELGRQAYIVFPLIEESESLSAKAATQEYEKLKEGEFSDFKLGLMHGKLKPQEKDAVMEAFREGEFQILVSTTVIEVGVDVPNSTIMVIENADRFGLAQLHQLRGRVGRGGEQSYCFLVSDLKSQTTRDRLGIMEQTNDGFVVAQKDLEIRGPGEFLGYRQSGLPDLVLADLVNDAKILEEARNAALAVMRTDPELSGFPGLRKLIEKQVVGERTEAMRSG
jgi:ATP-dependent DNA helicase RecG